MEPKSWRTVPIKALCKGIYDGPHATPKKTDTGPIFLGISSLSKGRLDLTNVEHLSEDDFIRWTRRVTPQAGDVVFSYETRLGEAALIPEDLRCCLGRRMALMRVNRDLADPGFLLYAFLGPQFQSVLRERTIQGSTVERIALIEFPDFPISVPTLPEQKAIARVLAALDDKIELNRRMNETLEAIARAIFKSWFVEFAPVHNSNGIDIFPSRFADSEIGAIPSGWRAGTLNELASTIIGGDWGKDIPHDDAVEAALCIRGADIDSLQTGGRGKLPTRFLKTNSLETRRLQSGDLVVEISGGSPTQSTGRPVLITAGLLKRFMLPITCSNFCRLVRLRDSQYSCFLYLWLRHLYASDEFLQYENGTTGIKNFAFTDFAQTYKLAVPEQRVVAAFCAVVEPLFAMMQTNGAEVETLEECRDVLLPKLLSGEIRTRVGKKSAEVGA